MHMVSECTWCLNDRAEMIEASLAVEDEC